jgi:hypothetical protein
MDAAHLKIVQLRSAFMSDTTHIDIPVPIIRLENNSLSMWPNFIETLVTDFNVHVKFALIETLELDRKNGKAVTWLYSDMSPEDSYVLSEQYFKLINDTYRDPGFSVSCCNHFYFGETLYFSQIKNPKARCEQQGDNKWYGPVVTELDRNYHDDNYAPPKVVQDLYDKYVLAVSETFLKPYPSACVLCVPVALNHIIKSRQRKIGAVFLHFGLSKNLSDEKGIAFAQDIFMKVNLYWHYNLTSESLHKQIENVKVAEAKVLAKADAHKRYLNEVMPCMEKLIKVVGDLDLAVAPSPKARAAKILLKLSEFMDKCFPATGDLHDPWGHKTIEELQKVRENIKPLAALFGKYMIDTEAFVDKEDLVNLLMKPIVDMLNLRENTTVTNNMNEPEPALCLAKCISGKRIPLAWILLALGHDKITASHWRLYSQFQSMQDSSSVLDVLHPLGMCVNKLTLTFKSLKVTPNSANSDVTMVLCPIWTASYQNFFESIETKRQLPSPSGGTARALFELLNCDYKLTLVHPIDKEPMILYRGDATDNPVCEIIVDSREVIFNWRMVPEPTYNSVNRNRDGEG